MSEPFKITPKMSIAEVQAATLSGRVTADEVERQCTRIEANAYLDRGPLHRKPPTGQAFLQYIQTDEKFRKVTAAGKSQFDRWWNGYEDQVGVHDHFHHAMRVCRRLSLHGGPEKRRAELDVDLAVAVRLLVDESHLRFKLIPKKFRLPRYGSPTTISDVRIHATNVIDSWQIFSADMQRTIG